MMNDQGDYNRPKLISLFARYVLIAAAMTLFFMFFTGYLFEYGWDEGFEHVLYFLPWAIALVFGIAASFHQGVVDEYIEATGFKNEEEAKGNDLNLPFPAPTLDEWERAIIFPYTLKLIIFSAFASLAFYGFVELGQFAASELFHPFVLFMPWLVAMSFGIGDAYMQGVAAHRKRLRGRREVDRRHGPRRRVGAPKRCQP
jgi:hypothetical protein